MSRTRTAAKARRSWGCCCWCGRPVRMRRRGRGRLAPRRVAGCPIHIECYREMHEDTSRRLDLTEGLPPMTDPTPGPHRLHALEDLTAEEKTW